MDIGDSFPVCVHLLTQSISGEGILSDVGSKLDGHLSLTRGWEGVCVCVGGGGRGSYVLIQK